jgi:uncharacterized surface protein with fasciclin (FAS1) repeats
MAQDPVATAASNNPLLTTLASALSGKLNPNVNLVDTLNNGQYTAFAPTDAAFGKLPPAKVDGTHATLQGANSTVSMTDTVLMPPIHEDGGDEYKTC